MNKHWEKLKEIVANAPTSAGVYRMVSEGGRVLYVGKAKNLRNRLTNYIRFEQLSPRIQALMSKTADIITITVAGETEALLVENDLIKHYQPHYNVLLRDDKGYQHLVITRDEYPRLVKHRGPKTAKGDYFGPFPSGEAVRHSYEEIQKIFNLRTCNDTYFANRTRPCLLYQIKRCSAPCVGYISPEDYKKSVQAAKDFILGRNTDIQKQMTAQMGVLAAAEKFEEAAVMRDKILALNKIQQSPNYTQLTDTDVIGFKQGPGGVSIQVFLYRSGMLNGHFTHFFTEGMDEKASDVLASFMMQFYDGTGIPREIIVPIKLPRAVGEALEKMAGKRVHVNAGPFKGLRQTLLTNAQKNAQKHYTEETHKNITNAAVWQELANLMGVQKLARVDVFDNSHIQGTSAVGAMIVATPNGFDKNQYRRFNIDIAQTNDDFGMMREILERRIKRGKAENTLPDAMIIDGGKGQLSAAEDIFKKMNVQGVALIAVAKGPKRNAGRETIWISGQKEPVNLDIKSDLIHLVQRLRDEAHRFAIGTHRMKRAQNMFHETLMDIEGIGHKRKKALMAHFGSASAVAGASLEEIGRVPGISEHIAKKIYTFYHN